ncbi:MAG TPA: cation diffusion facilitator family transporter [Candidatus Latescibacteria bacterium]|nr:cation diffusion facilitator family transporter [Candidatus Latescibacterota bacterium]
MSHRIPVFKKAPRATIPWEHDPTTGRTPQARSKSVLTGIGIGLSVLLVCLKGFAGWRSGSTAVISDAFNSVLDIISYSALYLSVRLQAKPADLTHHYGHHRAEPLAGFVIAVFAAILGGMVLRDSVLRLLRPDPVRMSALSAIIVLFAIVSKVIIAIAYRRGAKGGSPAMDAAAIDSRNDAMASSVALIGLIGGAVWPYLDGAAGLAIGAWILGSGVRVGLENIGFLLGKAPSKAVLEELRAVAETVPGLIGTNNIRAHYVGNSMHVEVHIEVDANLSIREAHDLAKTVGQRLERLDDVYAAFVHTDPVDRGLKNPQQSEQAS